MFLGMYLKDVPGAFDKVLAPRLVRKLDALGMHERLVKLLTSWLRDCETVVVVKGVSSSKRILANSVYQRKVLDPPLWNAFCQDARAAVNCHNFHETMYADDFNAFRSFDRSHSSADIHVAMRTVQTDLRTWGRALNLL